MYTKENCGKMLSTKKSENCCDENLGDDTHSLAQSRSRRQKVDRKGTLSAFEKLRQAKEKGVKNKYEVEDEKNVYDVIEETEYSELVKQRQEDDWIVDDDGAGYVEDGREIFDDLDDDQPATSSRKHKEDKKKNKNIVRPGTKPKQDIKTMFAAAAVYSKKKPETSVSLANDDILDDLIGELHKSSKVTKPGQPSAKPAKKAAYNPFKVETNFPSHMEENITAKSSHSVKRGLSYEMVTPSVQKILPVSVLVSSTDLECSLPKVKVETDEMPQNVEPTSSSQNKDITAQA